MSKVYKLMEHFTIGTKPKSQHRWHKHAHFGMFDFRENYIEFYLFFNAVVGNIAQSQDFVQIQNFYFVVAKFRKPYIFLFN